MAVLLGRASEMNKIKAAIVLFLIPVAHIDPEYAPSAV